MSKQRIGALGLIILLMAAPCAVNALDKASVRPTSTSSASKAKPDAKPKRKPAVPMGSDKSVASTANKQETPNTPATEHDKPTGDAGDDPDSDATETPATDTDHASGTQLSGQDAKPLPDAKAPPPITIWGVISIVAIGMGLVLLCLAGAVWWLALHITRRADRQEQEILILSNQIEDISSDAKRRNRDSNETQHQMTQEIAWLRSEVKKSRTAGAASPQDASSPSSFYPPPSPPPPPPPPPSFDRVIAAYRALLSSHNVVTADFNELLRSHGEVFDVVYRNGGLALIPYVGGAPDRTLSAVVLSSNDILLVPSCNFIKEFSMIYKETLDATPEIETAFMMIKDGTGWPSYVQAAIARRDLSGQIVEVNRGRLGGFYR